MGIACGRKRDAAEVRALIWCESGNQQRKPGCSEVLQSSEETWETMTRLGTRYKSARRQGEARELFEMG